MEDDDSAIVFGLILCLAVAIIGLYIGSGSASDQDQGPRAAHRSSFSGQVMNLD
jgi:hypothetical protein